MESSRKGDKVVGSPDSQFDSGSDASNSSSDVGSVSSSVLTEDELVQQRLSTPEFGTSLSSTRDLAARCGFVLEDSAPALRSMVSSSMYERLQFDASERKGWPRAVASQFESALRLVSRNGRGSRDGGPL